MSESATVRRITRVHPYQLAKVMGLIAALFGGIIGVIFIIVGLVAPNQHAMIMFGVAAPFLYGAMGFVAGMLHAFCFNWAAERMGGVEITFISGDR